MSRRWNATVHDDQWWIHNERRENAPALIIVDAEVIFNSDPDSTPEDAYVEAERIAEVIVDALNTVERP